MEESEKAFWKSESYLSFEMFVRIGNLVCLLRNKIQKMNPSSHLTLLLSDQPPQEKEKLYSSQSKES